MPRGFRYVVLAALGWVALTGTAKQPHQNGHQRHYEANGQQGTIAPAAIVLTRGPGGGGAPKPKCEYKDGSKTDCDIVAVKAAFDQARDADWQADAAAFEVLIGVATLVAAFLAAYWAKEAAKETRRGARYAGVGARLTKRAVDHAAASNRVALDAQRAWIVVRPRITVVRNDDLLIAEAEVVFENIGKMVASAARYKAGIVKASAFNIAKEREDFTPEREVMLPFYFPIIPGETRTFRVRGIFALDGPFPVTDPNGRVTLILFALCDYGTGEGGPPGKSDGIWHITNKADDPFLDYGVAVSPLPDASHIELRGGLVDVA